MSISSIFPTLPLSNKLIYNALDSKFECRNLLLPFISFIPPNCDSIAVCTAHQAALQMTIFAVVLLFVCWKFAQVKRKTIYIKLVWKSVMCPNNTGPLTMATSLAIELFLDSLSLTLQYFPSVIYMLLLCVCMYIIEHKPFSIFYLLPCCIVFFFTLLAFNIHELRSTF